MLAHSSKPAISIPQSISTPHSRECEPKVKSQVQISAPLPSGTKTVARVEVLKRLKCISWHWKEQWPRAVVAGWEPNSATAAPPELWSSGLQALKEKEACASVQRSWHRCPAQDSHSVHELGHGQDPEQMSRPWLTAMLDVLLLFPLPLFVVSSHQPTGMEIP